MVVTVIGVNVPVQTAVATAGAEVTKGIPLAEAMEATAVGCKVAPNAEVNDAIADEIGAGSTPLGRVNVEALKPGTTTPGGKVNTAWAATGETVASKW